MTSKRSACYEAEIEARVAWCKRVLTTSRPRTRCRVALIEQMAEELGISQAQCYVLLQKYDRDGPDGLNRKTRRDKGYAAFRREV